MNVGTNPGPDAVTVSAKFSGCSTAHCEWGAYKLCTRNIYPIKTFRLVGTTELVISNDLNEKVTNAMACNTMIVKDVQ